MNREPETSFFKKKAFSERLLKARQTAGLSRDEVLDLATTGFSRSSLQEWEAGVREPKIDYIYDLARIYNIHPWSLIDSDTPSNNTLETDEDEEYIHIPAYDITASAGHGLFTEGATQPSHHIAYPKNWLEKKGLKIKNLAIIFAQGDSMEPTIPDGSTLVVDRSQTDPKDGKIYVISIDGELYVKRIQRLPTGLRLISDNKEHYDPIDITKAEQKHLDIQICGQVIHASYDL